MSIKTYSIYNNNPLKRLSNCTFKAIRLALKTAIWLLSIMLPVSLGVTLLDYTGILKWVAYILNPMFNLLGLPGESALVFLTSIFLNIYSCIAVIGTLTFSSREITILALMCLISHNLIVETAVQKKTGSKIFKMLAIRLFSSITGAILLNIMLPAENTIVANSLPAASTVPIHFMLLHWATSSAYLTVKIIILVTLLMIFQKVLEEFGIMEWLTKIFTPVLKLMGLPESTSFSWIVANVLGLVYGSAIMIEQSETGKLPKKDANILNHHIAISHSMLEDTLLFVAIGASTVWITFPRIFLAVFMVWFFILLKKL